MPATEYVRWCLFLEREKNRRTPEMWYHAQTTAALHCVPFWVWGKKPPEGLEKPETFLLTFTNGSDKPGEREKSEEELREEATRKSKSSGWAAFLKMDKNPSGTKRGLPPGVVNAPVPDQQVRTVPQQSKPLGKRSKRPAVDAPARKTP